MKTNKSVKNYNLGISTLSKVRIYSNEHREDYERFSNEFSESCLLIVIAFFVVVCHAPNLIIADVKTVVSSLSIFTAMSIVIFLKDILGIKFVGIFHQHFGKIVATYLLVSVTSLTFLFSMIELTGQSPPGSLPPNQIVLSVALIFSFMLKRVSAIVATNIVVAFSMVGVYKFFNVHLFKTYEVIGGFFVGTGGALILSYVVKAFFQATHIESQTNTHLTNELKKMVYNHQIKMLLVKEKLEDTMPTFSAGATLGEFDVGSSSEVSQENKYEEFKKEFFEKCHKIINDEYEVDPANPNRPFAKSFFIKENGDGFLFSSGHPFQLPKKYPSSEYAAFDSAVKTIESFIDFNTKIKLPCIFAIVCLTHVELKPFYTKGIATQYDFEQYGISRVSRVSEFRRFLMKHGHIPYKENQILFDEVVWERLSSLGLKPTAIFETQETKHVRSFKDIKYIYSLTYEHYLKQILQIRLENGSTKVS